MRAVRMLIWPRGEFDTARERWPQLFDGETSRDEQRPAAHARAAPRYEKRDLAMLLRDLALSDGHAARAALSRIGPAGHSQVGAVPCGT